MKQFYTAFIFIFFFLYANAQTPTGSSTEVGITNGELSVSLSGAANYAIPIAVPPGINEVVPQISLVYNSQGTNGIAGYRWNIAGISTITRIPQTKFHDGIINQIGGSVFDRFALDGQRLLKKDSSFYFMPGAGWRNVYELENFSNIKITSKNQTKFPSSTSEFRVEYPDGSFAIYTLLPNQTNMVYAINYWENAQGIRISYEYNDVAGKKLTIASIKYGSTTTNTPLNEIQFVYKTRVRLDQGYFLGQSLTDDTILSKIKVIGNGVGFRNYELKYDQTFLKYERLISITESNGDNTKSYNPTKFEYEKTVDSEVIEDKPNILSTGVSNINSENSKTVSGDFDGDGKMDFVLYPTTGDFKKKKFWLFTNINSSNYPSEVDLGDFEELFPSTFLFSSNKVSDQQGITAVQSATNSKAVNFNTYYNSIYGVGIMNTKQVTFPVRNIKTCRLGTTKVANESQSKEYLSGDFNGDGLTDIIAIDNELKESICTTGYPGLPESEYLSTGNTYFIDLDVRKTTNFWNLAGVLSDYRPVIRKDKIEVFDVNGDGKTDILHFKKGSVTVYTLNQTNELILLWKTTDSDINPSMSILPGDYNGDGKMDFICPKSVGINSYDYFKFLSTGNAFEKFSQTYDFPNYGTTATTDSSGGVAVSYLIPLDFNGDGKTDIVHFKGLYGNTAKQGAILIRSYNNTSTGFGFSSESYIKPTTLIKSYAAPIFLSPNTNNQYVEVGAITDNLIYTFNSKKDFSKETLLTGITTGNGVKETISYSSLEQNDYESVYNPSPLVETFPNRDIIVAPNFKVVSKLEKKSASDYKKQLFSYNGAVSNSEGLGFFGFRAVLRTNWHSDNLPLISNVSKYDMSRRGANVENFSVLGLIAPYSTSPSTDFITKSVIDYNTATEALQTNKVFKLVKKSIKEYNGLENTSSETNTEYDAYNNPKNSTTYLKEGGATVQTSITNLTYKEPTEMPHVIGRLASKVQTVSITGNTISTEEQYDYTDTGLLKEIKKKGTGTNVITEANDFDSFGNVTKKTISASDITSRETSYVYDPSGRFMIKSTDAEGLFKTYDYNWSSGSLISETSQNGLTTAYEYDSWLKKVKTTDYLGKTNKYTYTRNGEKTIVINVGDDGSANEETFDDLGRKIKTGVKNINGTFSYVSYLYDALDRNYKVSEPYFGTNPTDWNETIYDAYGRIKTSIAFTGKTVQFSYSGLTTVADEGYKSKSTTKNVIGNIVSMTDSPGGTITYKYFADGNLMESDFGGAKTIITQDGWGRKTSLNDPSAGTYFYTYNSLGEVTSETTPNGIITYKLSPLGRVIEKAIVGNNTNSKTTYSYDDKMLLSLSKFEDLTNGANTTTNTYTYDGYKRISTAKETTPYAEFIKDFRYDAFGRIEFEKSTAKAAGKESVKEIKNIYLNGAHSQILDNDTSTILWQTNEVNANGQLVRAQNGPIAIVKTYDKGFVTQIKYDQTANSTNILTLNTIFDKTKGNLTSRTNNLFNWNESFDYDVQDRLTKFANGQNIQVTQIYDDKGRILQNSLGTYNYDPGKPYRNSSVDLTPEAISYYSDRTLTAEKKLNVRYNVFKSPVTIEEAGIDKISFDYNDNNDRSAMFYGGLHDHSDKLLRPNRKYYSSDGSMEIKQNINTGVFEFVTYIGGDGYSAPIAFKSDGDTNRNYLYL